MVLDLLHLLMVFGLTFAINTVAMLGLVGAGCVVVGCASVVLGRLVGDLESDTEGDQRST